MTAELHKPSQRLVTATCCQFLLLSCCCFAFCRSALFAIISHQSLIPGEFYSAYVVAVALIGLEHQGVYVIWVVNVTKNRNIRNCC